MLVLSRKKNEKIMIGDNIVLTIVEIRRDKVRLGFEAPLEVPIYRQEVYNLIKSQQFEKESHAQSHQKENQDPIPADPYFGIPINQIPQI